MVKRMIHFQDGSKLTLDNFEEGEAQETHNITIQKFYKNNKVICIIINNINYMEEEKKN